MGDELVVRGDEITVVEQLVDRAVTGPSAALLLLGEPGVGKTTLLDDLASRSAGRLRVLRCTGVQAEAELAHSGLSEIVYPLRHLLDRLPDRYRDAARGVLGIAAPEVVDRLTIGAATLTLLAEAAELEPLLVLVDDAHWIDGVSAAALLFAARRLRAERIAMVFAVRTGARSIFHDAGLDTLTVQGLDRGQVAVLARHLLGAEVPDHVTDRLWHQTAGNPLAVTEICRYANSVGDLADLTPLPVGERLAASYRNTLNALADEARLAVTVAAASFTDELAVVVSALRHLGCGEDAVALAEGAAVLVRREGRLRFRHPLLRSVAYHDTAPAARCAAHRALAQALAPETDFVHRGQRAWHLAAAASTRDAAASAALADIARESQQRGSLSAAASAYERAAAVAPRVADAARLLTAAAAARVLAGEGDPADELLDRAAAATDDPAVLMEIDQLRGQLALVRQPPRQLHDQFVAAATQLATQAPAQAATLLIAATGAACMGGEVILAQRTADRARAATAALGGPVAGAAAVLQAQARMLAGRSEQAREALASCREFLATADPIDVGTEVFSFAAMSLMWLEDHDSARALLAYATDRVRAAGALERMPLLLGVASELQLRTGRWNEAYVTASQATAIGRELHIRLPTAYAISTMARIDAARGNRRECANAVGEIRHLLHDLGAELVAPYADLAAGMADLSDGTARDAAGRLQRTARHLTTIGVREPTVLQHHPDLVDALLAAGDRPGAESAAAELHDWLRDAPSNWGRAVAMRCTAILAAPADADEYHLEALRLHEKLTDPFAQARMHLAYGVHLRRTRRRRPARDHLQAALDAFETLHAGPWQDRTRHELRATGVGTSRRAGHTAELTAQENQIALAVAEGHSNREVAAALFLSVKTIEYHLGHIYAKLGITSRVELVRRLS